MFDYVMGLTLISVMVTVFGLMIYTASRDVIPSWKDYCTVSGITNPATFTVAYFTDPQLQQHTMMFIISSVLLSIPFIYHFIANVVPKIKENRNPLKVALRKQESDYNNRVAHYVSLGMLHRDAKNVAESELYEQSQQLLNTYKQLGV